MVKSPTGQKTGIITEDTLISEILKKSPRVAEILMEYGLMCASCQLAGKHSFAAIKNIYGFSEEDIDEILVRVNKLIKNENKQ